MTHAGLVSNVGPLLNSAKTFFRDEYGGTIHLDSEIAPNLQWRPSLHVKASNHLWVAAEVSEVPYPAILRLRHAEVTSVPLAVSVYSVCPEEAFLKKESQADVRLLRSHGYGLITIDESGAAMKRYGCIPLVQFISEADLKDELTPLPAPWRTRLRHAYEKYLVDPVAGVQDVSVVLEGAVLAAGKRMNALGWIGSVSSKVLAGVLDDMAACAQCRTALAAIGGARNYVKSYRNPSHHYPKNKEQAYRKYRDAPHGFRDGIKQIIGFREAMAGIGVKFSI